MSMPKLMEGQAVQLEDGTVVYIHNSPKVGEGMQAVQLEDGTTAFITQAMPDTLSAPGTIDPTSLNLDNFTTQVQHQYH